MECLIVYDPCVECLDSEFKYLNSHHIKYCTNQFCGDIDSFATTVNMMKRVDAVMIKIPINTDEYDLIRTITKKFDKIILDWGM